MLNLYGEATGICISCAPRRIECSNCSFWRTTDEFYLSRGNPRKQCKLCQNVKQKHSNHANREHIKQYREDHREEIAANKKQYYEDHREEIAAYSKQYREDHREEINAAANARNATEEGKLNKNTRELVRLLYKGKLGPKRLQAAEQLVGCTRSQYRAHIDSQLTLGMHERNYGRGEGKWNNDHIVPFKAFKNELSTQRHIVCWWENVQPLWHAENNSKSGSYKESDKQDLIKRYNAWVSSGCPPPSNA